MISFHCLPFEIFLLLSLSAESSRAVQLLNQTLDDSDASIHYSPGWSVSTAMASHNFGGSHHFSYLEDANASFVFKGVAAYILSPLWPFPAAIVVAVDDLDPTIVDLRDYSLPTALLDGKPSVPSKVVWGLGDLKNEEHVLTIRASHDSDYAAVDGLMYTQVGGDVDSNIPPPQPHTLLDAASSSIPPQSNSVPIIVGAVVGVSLGVLGILLGLLYFRHRRRILLKYGHLVGIDVRCRKPPHFEMLTPATSHKRLPSTPTSSTFPTTHMASFSGHTGFTLQLSIPSVPRRTTSLATNSPSSSFFPTPQDAPGTSMVTGTNIHKFTTSHETARVRFEDQPKKQIDSSGKSHGGAVVNDAGIKVHIHHRESANQNAAGPSLGTTQRSSINPGMSYSFRARNRLDLIVEVDSDFGGSRSTRRGRVYIPPRRSSLAPLMHNVSPKKTSSAFRHQRFQKTYPRRSAPVGPRDQIVNRRSSGLRTSLITNARSRSESSPSSILSVELTSLFPAPPSNIPVELWFRDLPSSSLQSPLSMREALDVESPLSMLATAASTISALNYLPPGPNDSRPLPVPPNNTRLPSVTSKPRVPLPELPTRGGKGRRSPSLTSVQTSAVLSKGTSMANKPESLPSPPTFIPQSLAVESQTRRVSHSGNNATETPTVASPSLSRKLPPIPSLSRPASQNPSPRRSLITILSQSPKLTSRKMSLSSSASLAIPPPPESLPPVPIQAVRREFLAPPESVPDAPQSARFTNDSFY